MNCKNCMDFINQEKCIICDKLVDICSICVQNIINILFIEPVIDYKILSWISAIIRSDFFCKKCILLGLYPDYQFNEKNIRINWIKSRLK